MIRLPNTIAYVVKRYPRFSETFIVNEILAHEAYGQKVEIFSTRPPVDTHFQDLLSRVRSPVVYLSTGSIKAQDLWDAIGRCSRVVPDTCGALSELLNECPLDIYCGVQLAELAVRRGIEHFHAHFASGAATVARIASTISGTPFSITAHAKDIFHEGVCENDLRRKLRDASRMFTVSDFNVRYLQAKFPQFADKILRLYNGIHLDDFLFQSPIHRPRQICAVGRFVEKKGFADLIQACGILKQQKVDFECVIVGSGELEGSLTQQISALGLTQQVRLLGPQPQRIVKQIIMESALMAAPCVFGQDGNQDGLPTVLLESMALGTPCVSTDVTGIPELVQDRITGLMVQQHSPTELAKAMCELLDSSELRLRLATSARQLIECRFDIAANVAMQRQYFSSCRSNSELISNDCLEVGK